MIFACEDSVEKLEDIKKEIEVRMKKIIQITNMKNNKFEEFKQLNTYFISKALTQMGC